ncbi:type II-B CRISPR-associated RNA-guided endonuclease Cas9/Csx12 [Parendozoicomonas haliclonae]|uniref:CRISPR-associated endonuclease Cas9 alpha-helical lobe domain-containing protein n=1 Tax=Parendozoicomonas haliclonae TaxID=1960125 RepID=A0A1X7AI56_9GAMM|nr:type II-B CRISPR-associated RNA-guided endonuclease Cas9/Csx12 [Parendozoicomonas haliclonae]SMA42963.1 hypothetical protein EHSB41UT_01530 [Parendozoicomonas haliclonae]
MRYISPISIDFGAKYTGIHNMHYLEGEDPRGSVQNTGCVLVMDDDNLQLSQVGRTQKRHQSRNYKRQDLARRLLIVILKDCFDQDVWQWPVKNREFLFGLINRRGFNRFDDDSLIEIEFCDLSVFESVLPDIAGYEGLEEWLQALAENAAECRLALQRLGRTREFLKTLPEIWKEEKKSIEATHKHIIHFLETSINASEEGHLHRRKYLRNIAADIILEQHGRLASLFQTNSGITPDQFANLVGHISNLQLRVLRRYFNDQNAKPQNGQTDAWREDHFSKQFWRWIKSWHCDEQTKSRWHELIKFKKKGGSVFKLMLTVQPELTIPPYEDQNNRRPPKDKTLFLNPVALNKAYPLWREIVKRLVAAHPELDSDHASTIAHMDAALDQDCILLQRMLDRTSGLDLYKIRALAMGRPDRGNQLKVASENLRLRLNQHAEPFIQSIARPYYLQINEARQGLWVEEDSLLLCLNRTPQRKARQLPTLLGRIVGDLGSHGQEHIQSLKQQWSQRGVIKGARTPKGWCKFAAEAQKDFGNGLKETIRSYRQLQARIKAGDTEEKLLPEAKKLLALEAALPDVARFIAQGLGLAAENSARFANPFSLAQIYNLLESDPSGFSHVSKPSAHENLWRMQYEQSVDGKDCARASVLSADSIRPFDGMLSRILEKQAYSIAKRKLKQIESHEMTSAKVRVPILIEENRFQFAEDLQTIKKNTRKKKDAQKSCESDFIRFEDKEQRICKASKGMCAYTGEDLGRYGEFDHIIPRSYTQKRTGAIFNSEANLIFVSSRGNQQKRDQLYTLAELDDRYLTSQFGSTNRQQIAQAVQDAVTPFLTKGELIGFHNLGLQEQRMIRHALFVPGLRDQVLQLLAGQRKAKVNGTQAWLAKRIIHHIRQGASATIEFDIIKVPTDSVRFCRGVLASRFPAMAKQSPQPVASHAIDAALVSGSLLMEPAIARSLSLAPVDTTTQAEWLKGLLPETIDIQILRKKPLYRKDAPASSPLFKAGLYGERFLPLLVMNDELRVGFTLPNSAKVLDHADNLYALLRPVLVCKDSHELPSTLAELQESLALGQRQILNINRQKAFAYLHEFGQSPTHNDNCLAIEALLYCVQKKKIDAHIYNKDKKTFKKDEDILADKFFIFETHKNNRPIFPRTVARIEKKDLTLPFKQAWVELCDTDELKNFLGTKQTLPNNFWRNFGSSLFPSIHNEDHQHKKTRKVYSLPLKISEGSYRVRRHTPEGASVWQRMSVGDFGAAGFAKIDGKTQWNKVVEIPHFAKSKNLHSLNRSLEKNPQSITYFDEWRSLCALADALPNGVIKVACAPGTVGRPYIRFEMLESQFIKKINAASGSKYKSSWELPMEIPNVQLAGFDIFSCPLLPKPRTETKKPNKHKARFLRLGKTVLIEYFASSKANKALQQAYEQGEPECI